MATTPGVPASGGQFTGPVTVPDATADGQPLAYDQTNALLGSNFIVRDPDPSMSIDATSGIGSLFLRTANTIRKGLSVLADGRFRLYDYDSARTVMLVSNTGGIDTTGAASVTVPAISGTSQAAQVTGFDATTGRLAIGGREVGDTGWRNVTPANDWNIVDGFLQLRRVGAVVTLAGHLNNAVDVAQTAYTLPNGFAAGTGTSAPYGITPAFDWTSGVLAAVMFVNGSQVSFPRRPALTTSTPGIRFYATFQTLQTWPTSLPGTTAPGSDEPVTLPA